MEVIISCGAQKTPQILMLSGVGPSTKLSNHVIPTIVDAPNVGQNLFDHSVFVQQYKLNDPSKGYALPFTGTMRPNYGQGNIPPAELVLHLGKDGLDTTLKDEQHPLFLDKKCHFMSLTLYFPLGAHPLLYPTVKGDGSHMGLASTEDASAFSRKCDTQISRSQR